MHEYSFLIQNASFLIQNAPFLIQNASFLNTKCLVLNTKCLVFAHIADNRNVKESHTASEIHHYKCKIHDV